MDVLAEYVEHLMTFVRMGDQTYAKWAAPKYEATDPFRLKGLKAALDVEIARFKEHPCTTTTKP